MRGLPQSIHFCGNYRSRNGSVKIKARCSILLEHCVIRTLFFQHQIGMRNSSNTSTYAARITNNSTFFRGGREGRTGLNTLCSDRVQKALCSLLHITTEQGMLFHQILTLCQLSLNRQKVASTLNTILTVKSYFLHILTKFHG